jgi:hypothetical protein
MHADLIISCVLIALFVTLSLVRAPLLEGLLQLTRPGASIVLVGGVVWLAMQGYRTSAILAVGLVAVVLREVWATWPRSDARRLYLDVGRDVRRFDPATSVDLQVANGTLRPDAPNLPPPFQPALLLFPPTPEQLAELSG